MNFNCLLISSLDTFFSLIFLSSFSSNIKIFYLYLHEHRKWDAHHLAAFGASYGEVLIQIFRDAQV